MPGVITYVGDMLVIAFLFLVVMTKKGLSCIRRYALGISCVIGFFLLQTLVGFLGNLYSPLLYVWGGRKVFAPYIYLLTCVIALNVSDVRSVIKVLEKLFVICFALVVIQFAMGYRDDAIGGIYGMGGKGTNGLLNVFISLISTVTVVQYLNDKASLKKTAIYLLMTIIMAAVVELKALFVELILIVGMALVLSKPSRKTVYIVGICAAGIALAIPAMYHLYPSFKNFFTWDFLMSYLSMDKGYAMTGDLNRIGGLSYIYQNILHSGFQKVFGIGLGNAEFSGYSFFTSDFYRSYQDALHYAWFAHLMFLLENGILGLLCFVLVFVVVFVKAVRLNVRNHVDRDLLIIACICCVLALFFAVYNNTIRDYNTTILLYFFIAIPCIVDKTTSERGE